MKMQRKIFYAFLLVIAIPTVVFLVIILELSTQMIEKRTISASELVVKESVKRVDTLLNNYRKASMQIYYNKNVMDILEKQQSDIIENSDNKLMVEEILGSIVNADKYLMSAVLNSKDNPVVQGSYILNISEYLDAHRDECRRQAGQLSWITSQKLKTVFGLDAYYFGAMRSIRKDDREIGELLFLIRSEFFDDIYAGAIPENSGNDLIIASDGVIVSSQNEKLIGTEINDERIQRIISGGFGNSGSFLTETEGEKSYLIYARSKESGWFFIRELEESTVLHGISQLKQSLIVIIILFCAFLIFISYLFSRGLSKPMSNLVAYIDGIGSESFEPPLIDRRAAGEEISKLYERLFIMSSRIENLIEEISVKERLKTQAELKALRSHISPHFIYNALDTIRWMAVINKQDNIKMMVSSLDKLMRYAADYETVLIRLSEELDIIKDYILIQKMRYSDIELIMELAEDTADLLINKFILQTIVENSIVHGFRDYEVRGVIKISSSVSGNVLVLIVEDNGRGFNTSQRQEEGAPRTGIKSVNQRLLLNYGSEFGVTVTSTPGAGTRVEIRLPVSEE